MATIQQQRDNLNIGLYLANTQFGATLDQILQITLGYNPNGPPPTNYVEHHDRRFRNAQAVGRDANKNRTPGYFAFNAMPFGNSYMYKAFSYVWINPNTNHPQVVPLPSGDLAPMRQLRDKDLDTRRDTNRSIRAAHNIQEQRQALARRDWRSLRAIQSRMIEDGSLGEILSGYYGLPYADIQEIIPQLPNQRGLSPFQKPAKDVLKLEERLMERKSYLQEQFVKVGTDTYWRTKQCPSISPSAGCSTAGKPTIG